MQFFSDIRDIYQNTDEHNLKRKCKIVKVFWWYKMKRLSQLKLAELFMHCRKLNILFIYIVSYCRVLKDVGLTSAHYLTEDNITSEAV